MQHKGHHMVELRNSLSLSLSLLFLSAFSPRFS